MFQSYPARAQAGIYLLLAIAAASVFSHLLDAIGFSNYNQSQASGAGAYFRRFGPLLAELPPGIKAAGYVTDLESDNGDVEFHLTQYAVAPILLDKGRNLNRYVIGNMMHEATAEFAAKHRLTPLKVYPAGVVLFERSVPEPKQP